MDGFKLILEFSDDSTPLLSDISNLFYDLELAHDFGYLMSEPRPESYRFDQFFWYRNGRPVPRAKKIKAARIVKESPLLLEVVVPSLGAIWILIQILEKVADRPLVREKLEREVAKLRREEAARRDAVAEQHGEFLQRLSRDPQAQNAVARIEQRLSENPIRIVRADVTVLSGNLALNDDRYDE